jgi:osmotically-inducible protein OsmY
MIIRKICMIILLTCLLTACIPVAFIAGAGAGGAMLSDKRPVDTLLKDRDIANTALKNLANDPDLNKHARITVAAFNLNVLMVGQAPTEELRDRAYQIVNAVPGIKRIYNEVTIQPPISKITQANDSWITTKVKTAMVAEKGLNSNQFKVITENSVVYLMGIVTKKQADIATDIARNAEGVKRVVRLFEYES